MGKDVSYTTPINDFLSLLTWKFDTELLVLFMAAKHPWPFNDQVVIYVRHLGPGVMVGQAWQEGVNLEQVPKKLCGEILMVKNYSYV